LFLRRIYNYKKEKKQNRFKFTLCLV
jgi:hypothetical protein